MKGKSPIWEYFEVDQNNNSELICKVAGCQTKVSRGSKNPKEFNTTNAWTHLRNSHPDILKKLSEEKDKNEKKPDEKEKNIKDYFARKTNVSKEIMDEKIGLMIIRDLQPISFVEDVGFKDLINTIDPDYVIPGRKYLAKKYLPRKFEGVKNMVKAKIKLNCVWAALTCDGWSSYTGQSYLSVTCHFIEDSWQRQNLFLSLYPLYKASTADYLSLKINDVLQEFELDSNRISSITHDQGSNIKKAASDLPYKSCICFAHLMQNCIKEAFSGSKRRKISPNEKICKILEKVRSICRYFKKSSKNNLLLEKQLIDLGLEEKKIIIDVPTRWDSIYSMLIRLLEIKEGVSTVLSKIVGEKKKKAEKKKRTTKKKKI